MWTRGQSTTLMECALHVLPCILDELLPVLELRPCCEERWSFETAAWHMDGWGNAGKKKKKKKRDSECFSFLSKWVTQSSKLRAHLRRGVVAFDNDRTVGWSHARHLQVVPRILADGGAGGDASRYGLCGFLVRVHGGSTSAALENKFTHITQKLMCSRRFFSFHVINSARSRNTEE